MIGGATTLMAIAEKLFDKTIAYIGTNELLPNEGESIKINYYSVRSVFSLLVPRKSPLFMG